MLNVAMLSKWHVHAEGYARELLNTGKVKITAVWDDDVARGSEWAKSLGADFEPDLEKLLSRSDVDAVVCDAPTTKHKDVIIAAARAKKHIFTEKALAPTVAECEEIKAEIEKAGVTFVISLPQRGTGPVQFARRMIADGAFGRVNLVRVRNGHNGVSGGWLPSYWFEEKDAAGGAMMDLGCHPMYTLAYLCGKPKRVSAIFNSPFGTPVDENAVATIEFENGIIGIAETSFIVYNTPSMLEVYGTEGALVCQNDDIKFISSKLAPYVRGYVKPSLPQNRPAPIVQFVEACINGTGSPEGLGIDDAIDLTRLLELSYIANNNNKIVEA
ncbi:MAG TPA: Gfo/Idh/MocA family oxidoreductase [Bacillota bacterium]|nr:Gfo/Idh/MocA family oxidoreductase [Clostridiales bacterium]HPT84398.1 Gfo/Idh/MocA family oxidoreductase [Bacillota bacterium]